jgi:hypothetical protein
MTTKRGAQKCWLIVAASSSTTIQQGAAFSDTTIASSASATTGATIGASSDRGAKQSRPLTPETLALQQQHRADLARRSRQRKKEYTLRLVARLKEHEKLLELPLSTRSSRGQNATAQLH